MNKVSQLQAPVKSKQDAIFFSNSRREGARHSLKQIKAKPKSASLKLRVRLLGLMIIQAPKGFPQYTVYLMGSGWFYSIGAIGLGCCSVVLVSLVCWGIYCNYMCSLTISLSWALYKNTNFTYGANSTSLHDPFYPTEAAP